MAISGDLRVSATLRPSPSNPLRTHLSPSKVDEMAFSDLYKTTLQNQTICSKKSKNVFRVVLLELHLDLCSCMVYDTSDTSGRVELQGFAVGSIDGRVELEYFDPSESRMDGYAFLCHPKAKDGKRHLASVNDIAFSPSISGAFVTGDNEGYVTAWDARSKKRLVEHRGTTFGSGFKLHIPGSYRNFNDALGKQLRETTEEIPILFMEMPPQIFIHNVDNLDKRSFSAGNSK